MEDSAFSDAFCGFLQGMVPNVSAAELLLELRARGEQGVHPRSHADRLVLEGFAAKGLCAAVGPSFVYRASGEVDAFVTTLAQAYRERPVTLFRVIYALRDTKVQSFAEAFRVRKED